MTFEVHVDKLSKRLAENKWQVADDTWRWLENNHDRARYFNGSEAYEVAAQLIYGRGLGGTEYFFQQLRAILTIEGQKKLSTYLKYRETMRRHHKPKLTMLSNLDPELRSIMLRQVRAYRKRQQEN